MYTAAEEQLRAYCSNIYTVTTGEETALHYAANKGHVQVIKYLHEQCNGDLNATYSKVCNAYVFARKIGISSLVSNQHSS